MTKTHYAFVAFLFAIGIGLIVLGTISNVEVTVWDVAIHIKIAKAVGLITILGSLVTFLVMYGASLPLTRPELERYMGRASHRATGAATRQHATRIGEKYARRGERDASRPLVSLARTSTEARLLLAAERKKQVDSHPTPTDDSDETTQPERTLH